MFFYKQFFSFHVFLLKIWNPHILPLFLKSLNSTKSFYCLYRLKNSLQSELLYKSIMLKIILYLTFFIQLISTLTFVFQSV